MRLLKHTTHLASNMTAVDVMNAMVKQEGLVGAHRRGNSVIAYFRPGRVTKKSCPDGVEIVNVPNHRVGSIVWGISR